MGSEMKTLLCPGCHQKLVLKKIEKQTRFRGVLVIYEAEVYVCPVCGLEAGTIESAGAVQRAIADAYRRQMKLLTGNQIRSFRNSKGWSRSYLAGLLNVKPVQIKRWESGLIQPNNLDRRLKKLLADKRQHQK